MKFGESDIVKNFAAVWRFRYTFFCQNKWVELDWSYH